MRTSFFVLALASVAGCAASSRPPERSLVENVFHGDGPRTVRVSAMGLLDSPAMRTDFDVSIEPAEHRAIIEPADRAATVQPLNARARMNHDDGQRDRVFYEELLFRALGQRCEITETIPRPRGMGFEFFYSC